MLAVWLAWSWPAVYGYAAQYGRLTGTVTDTEGSPLIGATVLVTGPAGLGVGSEGFAASVERVLTDTQGRFTIDRLLPGRYTLRVSFPARLPMVRTSVRVAAGETSHQNFVLADVFLPFRFKQPGANVSNLGDDWKWVLRSSPATRPVLRYTDSGSRTRMARFNTHGDKLPLPPSQRLIGITPGGSSAAALSSSLGMGSVLAYLRPLSVDSDVLVAGSMSTGGVDGSSLATVFRRNVIRGDPQELVLVVHQLSLNAGPSPMTGLASRSLEASAQAITASYRRTQHLSGSLTLTSGLELDYLKAARATAAARPEARLDYQASPSNVVSVKYGFAPADADGSLMDRVDALNAFPRMTVQRGRPWLEEASHAEISLVHRLNKSSQVQVAAYHDSLQNAVVEASEGAGRVRWLAAEVLPNPSANGVTFNAGNYRSSGVRAALIEQMGNRVEASVVFSQGTALALENAQTVRDAEGLRAALKAEPSRIIVARVSANLPISNTRVTTSYGWAQRGRVTDVDPFGLSAFQGQPYLALEIRQPLPTPAFFPGHVEALADFRNLLAQGYIPVPQSGDEPLFLTSACRSFRGGFSVQF